MCVRSNKDITPEPVAPEGTSCTHNDWDNLRVKCKKTHLRCRVCCYEWNVSLMSCEECSKFPKGNCSDPTCTLLHIHAYKCKVKEEAFLEKQRRKTKQGQMRPEPPVAVLPTTVLPTALPATLQMAVVQMNQQQQHAQMRAHQAQQQQLFLQQQALGMQPVMLSFLVPVVTYKP